ncbi:MAG TPA: hypothetical protein VG710_05765 [Opitutus sp.]|nr:hypothetical protein [Opitutus sp.]
MTGSIPLLEASPPDPTPDAGPKYRGGPFAYFIALTFGLTALGGGLLLVQSGRPAWGVACLVVFGAVAARSIACLVEHFRHPTSLPRLHAVLGDVLAFRIRSTCRDVAATVFFDSDKPAAGSATRLLCFVENYASRQRVARFRIGPHPALGLAAAHVVDLHLAAGQAAVYVRPLSVAAALAPGEHDLPVTLQVQKPTGTGVRLPGSRRHLYDLWTVHFAAPFTVSDIAAQPSAASEPPRFLTLASASEKQPRLDALQFLAR